MRQITVVVLFIVSSTIFVSCLSKDHDRCGKGYTYENGDCFVVKSAEKTDNTGQDAGDEIDPAQWIGSACRCNPTPESECDVSTIPMINGGEIMGCDSVPKDWPGAELACHRSYAGDLSVPFYYANGFCSLVAVGCTGDSVICDLGIVGDYEAMVSCPENSALVAWAIEISQLGLAAELSYKNCTPFCETDRDCRNTENDPLRGEKTQYKCLEKNGVRFCQDPRNLSGKYTVEAF